MREIRRTMRETMRNQVQPKETMRNHEKVGKRKRNHKRN
jgi:hypothetical protein